MAEAILEVVLENLSSLIQKELGLFLGFDQDLKRLSSTLTAMKATLEDAEEKQFSYRAIKDWLQKLEHAAHILDDILDECATQALQLEYGGSGLLDKVQTSCLSSFNPKHVIFRRKIAKEMRMIRDRLGEIAEEKNQFHFIEMHTERRNRVIDWRQTTSIATKLQIYGREEDADKIVKFLVGDASNFEDLTIFPIVGMGGLGKTTLAQLIYNHERVVNHFEQRIWVCVSEDFNLKRMTKVIIESASGEACEDLDLDPLQKKLQKLLQMKRFLLVLDDVWDEHQENWERLKNALACGAKGASILVTTRLSKVASIMGTTPPYQLSVLSKDDCWEVFKQRAFQPNEECTELVVIGKEIVKKCGGVPLAAKTLGGLLRFKREEKEWLYVKESKLWNLTQDENSVMPALRLSYLNLSIQLRQCFAFCAIFPKGKIIGKHFMIKLWVANGFISSNQMLEAEDVGDEVVNELYWRSLFQDIETDEFGKITYFKMHDLVHDLSQSIAEGVCHNTNDNGVTRLSERICHLLIHNGKSFKQLVDSIQLHQFQSLRTCIIQNPSQQYVQLLSHVFRCYSLRLLDIKALPKLSSSIGYFKHLRLPDRVKFLKSLRHLCLTECNSLSRLAPEIGRLTSLRTLSMYIVGKQRGLLLGELGQLNLTGELHIKHMERVKNVMDAKDANLKSKQLNKLVLSWDRNEESQVQENVEQIIEVLQPHPKELQTFCVEGYPGVTFPQWIASHSLKNLSCVNLMDCESCLHLPPLGKLPSLNFLKISNMKHLKHMDNEPYDVGLVGNYIALEFLQISHCPKLALPCLPSLKQLQIEGKSSHDLLSSIHIFHSLECLRFMDNEELISFPDEMLRGLTSLKKLEIYYYSKLEVLPLEIMNLNAIQELNINHCNSLEPVTDQMLQGFLSLKRLEIVSYCKFNFSTGFQYLTSLEDLTISSCPEVQGFPESLQHMTSLQSLTLCDLCNLRSLPDWLGNLALLHSLIISKCPKLMHLPMSIQCLSTLQSLSIYGCPELKIPAEEDWPTIPHIPDIHVSPETIYTSERGGCYTTYGIA
ncbi:hypothetical protein TanjilG_00408 [Lupinus angustifolius]|uniref:Uncharacterized protein n=1 Tax=Lupinus angustifolius TaxID=3871 RepID=A0A1J7HCX4_LUPAN|nr:hypothetical protein TanjilG_00406 [Lupinus angustifolius]OIW10470.1 hypothetical protein TanjilG_00408 [Lupinus angustifolius]